MAVVKIELSTMLVALKHCTVPRETLVTKGFHVELSGYFLVIHSCCQTKRQQRTPIVDKSISYHPLLFLVLR